MLNDALPLYKHENFMTSSKLIYPSFSGIDRVPLVCCGALLAHLLSDLELSPPTRIRRFGHRPLPAQRVHLQTIQRQCQEAVPQ